MKVNVKNLSYLLVSVALIVLATTLPKNIILFSFGVLFFSLNTFRPILRNAFKILFLFLGVILIKIIFKTYILTDAGVALVAILAALKTWELEGENDHFNMFLILCLLECCLFLMNPTFIVFFIGFFKIIFFFYFILKIRNYDFSLLSIRRLLILIVPSLIFSLLMFYTFPRFTQGFISSGANQLLFSGNESHLNSKELGALNLSSDIVFKVHNTNQSNISLNKLYWRSSVLWDYHQEVWRTGYINLKAEQPKLLKPTHTYRVKLTRNPNEFLPTLDGLSNITRSDLEYSYFSEGSFRLKKLTRQEVAYDVITDEGQLNSANNFLIEKKGLKLKSINKEQIAQAILAGKNPQSSEEKIDFVINYFKSRKYEYSLSPKLYANTEDFILNGTSGYCSHFATAFTYMARSVGIPARIISGYQGGEINPYDHSITVRELDSHVWVELFIENKGWTRFDPTGWVAPGRIMLGSQAFHDKLEPYINLYYFSFPKDILRVAAFVQFNYYIDSINSNLNTTIFHFDREKQQKIFDSFMPKNISLGWPFVAVLIFLLSFLPWLFHISAANPEAKALKKYKRFLNHMKKKGVEKNSFETASAFAERCNKIFPTEKELIEKETTSYIKDTYGLTTPGQVGRS
jgi:transglutaminase-like putative cysteine protease